MVGSKNSSNSNRLKEVAQQCGVTAHLIDDYRDLDPAWLIGKKKIGITAGASAPEQVVTGVVGWMKEHGATKIVELKGITGKGALSAVCSLFMMERVVYKITPY